MEDRGKDAWGATNGVDEVRHIGRVTDSWQMPDWCEGIFHTRAATHGDKDKLANTHPFRFGDVIGIHNGIVRSHTKLNTTYNRDFDVDSQHIFKHIADNLPMSEIEGYGAVVWYQQLNNSIGLHFTRFNTFDMHIFTLESGELVFCSLADPVERAVKMFGGHIHTKWKIEDNVHYGIGQDNDGRDILTNLGPMVFGSNFGQGSYNSHYINPHPQSYYSTYDGYNSSSTSIPECYLCRGSITKDMVFCVECLKIESQNWQILEGHIQL